MLRLRLGDRGSVLSPSCCCGKGKQSSFLAARQKRRVTGSSAGGETMAVGIEVVRGRQCQGSAVVTDGSASHGTARARGQADAPCGRTVLRTSAYPGGRPAGKPHRGERTLQGRGSRDSARVLRVGPPTGSKDLKKSARALTGEQSGGRGVWSRGKDGGNSPG
jgi:hypothetical protein